MKIRKINYLDDFLESDSNESIDRQTDSSAGTG